MENSLREQFKASATSAYEAKIADFIANFDARANAILKDIGNGSSTTFMKIELPGTLTAGEVGQMNAFLELNDLCRKKDVRLQVNCYSGEANVYLDAKYILIYMDTPYARPRAMGEVPKPVPEKKWSWKNIFG